MGYSRSTMAQNTVGVLLEKIILTTFGPTCDPRKPTMARAPGTLVVLIGH